MSKGKYYAVRKGRQRGIFRTWPDCQKQVLHYPGAQYKSFATEEEAQAYLHGESKPSAGTDSSCRLSLADVLGMSEEAGGASSAKGRSESSATSSAQGRRGTGAVRSESSAKSSAQGRRGTGALRSANTVAGSSASSSATRTGRAASSRRSAASAQVADFTVSILLGTADFAPSLVSSKSSDEAAPSMKPECIEAYVDGSFNKGAGIVGSGAVVFHQWKKESLAYRTDKAEFTAYWNVSGELLATVEVVKLALDRAVSTVDLYYDYEGIEKWATGAWKRNNPLTQAYEAFMRKAKKDVKVRFHKVRAHTGDTYNEEADRLAKLGAGM